MHAVLPEVDMASKLARDPNSPHVPMGGSKNEILYILVALCVIALIALSFWFQANR